VLVVVAVLLALVALAWIFQRRLIYLPDNDSVSPAEEYIEGARDVTLSTSDGLDLAGWHIAPRSSDRDTTIVVANGNAGNRSGRAPLARALSAEGFTVVLFDYRGYGGNPGSPSEEGLALDVRAARRFVVEDLETPPERIFYFGESIGTGVVTELATEHPPGAMLLRSPFVDLAAVGRVHYPFLPVGLLLWDRYPVAAHIAEVEVPVTVVYGTDDAIVPPDQSRLVAAAGGAVETVAIEGAGHNDRVMLDGPELVAAVLALADRAADP
jgi:pimeloyl-ACP methyl ester carboxylesterase